MNERGFFTIIGLCLLLILAISIKGVQEFEGNYSVGVYSVKSENELQNIADSALIEAAEKIRTGEFKVPDSSKILYSDSKQVKILTGARDNIDFEVWGEHATLERYSHDYSTDKIKPVKEGDKPNWTRNATILISVASCDSGFVDGKIYRKSIAYILDNDPETIHFMNDL